MRAGSCKAQIVLSLRYPVRNIKNPNPSQLKELLSVLVFNSFCCSAPFPKNTKNVKPFQLKYLFKTCVQWLLSLCPLHGNTNNVIPSQLKCSFLYLFSMVFVSPNPYQKLQNGKTSQLKCCFRCCCFSWSLSLCPRPLNNFDISSILLDYNGTFNKDTCE